MSAKKIAVGSPVPVAEEKLRRELDRVVARREQLWSELAEHNETMQQRATQGGPVKRLLAQHNRMRERYCAVEERRQELLAQLPPAPVGAADDF